MGLKEEKKYKYLFRGAFVKAKAKIPDKWQEYKIVVADPVQKEKLKFVVSLADSQL